MEHKMGDDILIKVDNINKHMGNLYESMFPNNNLLFIFHNLSKMLFFAFGNSSGQYQNPYNLLTIWESETLNTHYSIHYKDIMYAHI